MLRVKFAAMTALAIGFSACSTVQENPNYQYSSKYQGSAPIVHNGVSQSAGGYSSAASSQVQAQTQTYQAPTYQTSSYNQAGQYSAAQQDCRRRENRRELIGGAAGGTIGAIAGKKIIGGTAGTIAGAAIGGTAGYGLGDISIDCTPQQSYQPVPTQSAYQSAPTTQPVYQSAPQQVVTPPPTYQAPIVQSSAVTIAPTDAQYTGQAVTGTPGYQAYQGNVTRTVTHSPPSQSANIHTGIQTAGVTTRASNSPQEIANYDYSANLVNADIPTGALAGLASETRIIPSSPIGLQSYTVQPDDTVYALSRKLCVGIDEITQPNNIDAAFSINIGQTIRLPQNRC